MHLIGSLLKGQRISKSRSHKNKTVHSDLGLSRVLPILLSASVMILSSLQLSGCDTGFGQSCTLPEGDAIQQACSAPQVEDGSEGSTTQTASATCALDNFPGCDTFLCLKYRGANPYCSLRCQTSAECGGGVCCPLVGDCRANTGGSSMSNMADPAMMSMPSTDPCVNGADCYCIRKSDLNR